MMGWVGLKKKGHHEKMCWMCGGTGKDGKKPCPTCEGFGVIAATVKRNNIVLTQMWTDTTIPSFTLVGIGVFSPNR